MTELRELEETMNKLNLSQNSTAPNDGSKKCREHLLCLEFTALELLLDGTLPHLHPPANVDQRHQPEQHKAQTCFGTSYYQALEVSSVVDVPLHCNDNTAEMLVHRIKELKRHPGCSRLLMVTFNPNTQTIDISFISSS